MPVLPMLPQHSFYTRPDIHGDEVVFTCEGDLWLGSISSRQAKRITADPGIETNARFSPDGRQIAFTGSYDGGFDVYVMATEGEAPRRLTFDPSGATVLGWTPDGKSVIYRSRRTAPVGGHHLYTVPATGGQTKELPVPQGEFASLSAGGDLAYVPVSKEWANWFRYRAGAADKIWTTDLKGHFSRLTNLPTVDTEPVYAGNELYFISERSGVMNLYHLDPKTRATTAVTSFSDQPVRYPGADQTHVVFEHGPGLGLYDIKSKQVSNIRFALNSDRIHSRQQRIPVTAVTSAAIGPTGKRVAVEVRGQILSVAAQNGDMRVIENEPGSRAQRPAWSADGQKLAFISDRSGENELWVADAAGGTTPRQLTHGLKINPIGLSWAPGGAHLITGDRDGRTILVDASSGIFKTIDQGPLVGAYDYTSSFVFSSDGKYVALQRTPRTGLEQIWIYDIANAKSAQVSKTDVNSFEPAFTADGKYLAFLADMAFTPSISNGTQKYFFDNTTRVVLCPLSSDIPSPFLPKNEEEYAPPAPKPATPDPKNPIAIRPVDLGALTERLIQAPVAPGRYNRLVAVPGHLILGTSTEPQDVNGVIPNTRKIVSFDIETRTLATLPSTDTLVDKSADGSKLLTTGPGGVTVIDVPTSLPTHLNLSPYSIVVDPEKEWRQVLEESWRIGRDFFFDPHMNGVDWNAVRRRYEAQLPLVGDRGDLTRLLSDMVSELNSGHAYVNAPGPGPSPQPMGFLGVDVASIPNVNAVKITKIYRGDDFSLSGRSPLAEPGVNVKEGDYILAIAGQPVNPDEDIQALLVGLAGQTVAVTVNAQPTMTGARVVRVRPLGSERSLRYQEWVAGRQEYVRTHGGENFGYLHVPDMMAAGVTGFVKGQFPNLYKDAMVYDFRYNGGGFVSSLLLENIAAKPQAWWSPRWGDFWTRENWANVGYGAALCNEFNFSDGELVIEVWKRMHLGPVIGKTTGGGEVGSGGGYTLIDGGSIYIPNYAGFADGRWLIEGIGAKPDIEVDQDPADVMAGRDPQLDKAIQVLKERLAKHPIQAPVRPPYPDRSLKPGS